MNSRYSNLILAVLGGILLWAAWPVSPFTICIFFAWLPLLFIAENTRSWKNFLGYTYITMLLWNVLTTWWIVNSTWIGSVSAFIANSLIMCIPWMLYFFTRKYFNIFISGLALIGYWISYEYIHHNWDLSWPWLSLGNAFATHTNWIQWYEYTGTTGGSIWVLLSNILLFNTIIAYRKTGRSVTYFKFMAGWIFTLFVPLVIAAFVKENLTLLHNKYNVIVVQPNIDPYNEKFEAGTQEAQLQQLISLSQQQIDNNTALVIWPETAIPFATDENKLKDNFFLNPLWGFLKQNPHINLLTGMEGYAVFDTKISRYARKIPNETQYMEGYNSAALCDSTSTQIYHKSKLVPGVEVLPAFLQFMAPVFEKFGGTTSGYARDSAAKVLTTTNHTFNIAPAICYESIYGDYLSKFIRKDANLICIITNDGWWGNTPGYKQHMNYARLRAIENRRWVARSANTGISCFIDPYGNVIQQLPWDKRGVLKQDVAAFVTETFFSKHGDWLSKIMAVLTVVFLLFFIYTLIFKNRVRQKAA